MSSEAEQKFANFDFSSDVAWQEHYNNLFPTPSHNQIGKIKRKWFKKNIDSSLEIETAPAAEESSSTNASSGSQPSGSSYQSSSSDNNANQGGQQAPGAGPAMPAWLTKIVNIVGAPLGKLFSVIYGIVLPLKDKFYFLEGVLKFVFIICAFLMPGLANTIAFVVCLLGFFRQTGKPRWDVNYGRKALENEFLQNLFYMLPFSFFPGQKTLVYFLPLGIHFWIGFCEFVNLKLPAIYPKIAKFADFTRQNRGVLMQQKAKLEIMLFAFILVMLFFGGSNLILVLFYGNFLKTKYMINPLTKGAFAEINYWIDGKLNSPYCPGILRLVVGKVRSLCAYLVKV